LEKKFLPREEVFRYLKLRIPSPIEKGFSIERLVNEKYHFETQEEIKKKKEQARKESESKFKEDLNKAHKSGMPVDKPK
ncbi:hypothetical protein ACFL35_15105, partial [Candidatus Riflebacteria bacterium]